VTLHPQLTGEARRHLAEVLCHELAHVVVWLEHGRRAKPHGPEWRALVERAGQRARLRLPAAAPPPSPSGSGGPETPASGVRARWEHRCPVCQMVRVAKRPVRGWRCAECRAAGLSGELEITRADRPRPE
jgi:predicted SprT family Zn-dependent metalloprotease